jgi:Zn-dependent protease
MESSLTLVQQLSVAILPIMLAITVHEAAHGLVADKLGDHTARAAGRVTLNPFKHIDPLGTVILPLAMYALSGFMFGWAKPVPVNWRNLANPRRDTALVAAAGPLSNLGMLLIWTLIMGLAGKFGSASPWVAEPLMHMARFGMLINAVLMALNLLPVLPLDGGRIVSSLLPPRLAYSFGKLERWGLLIMIGLLASGLLSLILMPLVQWLLQFSVLLVGIFL